MSNAPTNRLSLHIVIPIAALLLSSCGSGSSSASPDSIAARIYDEAFQLFETGDYARSLTLLDSIDHTYAQAFEARKQARLLRPQVVERKAKSELSLADSLMVVNQIRGEELRKRLEFVSGTGVEGYYVAAGTRNVDVRSVPGLHCRVSPDYHFYIIASSPSEVDLVAVQLKADGQEVTSSIIAFDGERNSRDSACETLTFTEAESQPLAAFVEAHPDSPISLMFIGENGRTVSMPLSDSQRSAILETHGFVSAINADRHYRLEKERLEKQIDIARDQLSTVASK